MMDEFFVAVSNHLPLHDQWVEINEVHDKMGDIILDHNDSTGMGQMVVPVDEKFQEKERMP